MGSILWSPIFGSSKSTQVVSRQQRPCSDRGQRARTFTQLRIHAYTHVWRRTCILALLMQAYTARYVHTYMHAHIAQARVPLTAINYV